MFILERKILVMMDYTNIVYRKFLLTVKYQTVVTFTIKNMVLYHLKGKHVM